MRKPIITMELHQMVVFRLEDDGYVVFNEAIGTYYYVCTPHVMMGMKGYIIV